MCPVYTLRQRKVPKRKANRWSGSLRFAAGSPRCSTKAGSATTSATPQTSACPDPLLPALLGPARRVGETNVGTDAGSPDARSASGRRQVAVIFARDSSTRGQMKLPPSPSGAREGGGREWVVTSTVQSGPQTQRDVSNRFRNHQPQPCAAAWAEAARWCGSAWWLFPSRQPAGRARP